MKCCMIISVMSLILSLLHEGGRAERGESSFLSLTCLRALV